MAFVDRLVDLRSLMGFTQEGFAKKIGLNKSTYNRIELGSRQCKVNELVTISKTLGVSTDYLLGLDVREVALLGKVNFLLVTAYNKAPKRTKIIVDLLLGMDKKDGEEGENLADHIGHYDADGVQKHQGD